MTMGSLAFLHFRNQIIGIIIGNQRTFRQRLQQFNFNPTIFIYSRSNLHWFQFPFGFTIFLVFFGP